MAGDLPVWLSRAVDAALEGERRRGLAERSARISAAYRGGRASKGVVSDARDALAYAVARMPATYAAVARVFAEIRDLLPDFEPASVLDAGCGPGTAGFAALDGWRGIDRLAQADHNAAFLDLAAAFAAAAGTDADLGQYEGELARLADAGRFDLVVLGYVLAEFPVPAAATLAEHLWAMTDAALVLVEPGTPAGHARIVAARDRLIAAGARILAPCPHEAACPLGGPDWCHFSERLPRRRAHMAAKAAVLPFEDERFSYLVAIRESPPGEAALARIVAPPRENKPGIDFKLCRPDGTAAHEAVPRRDKPRFAAARRLRWGDRLDA